MLDTSPAVRDTTIELVGKYIVSRPDLAVHFLPQILGRLSVSPTSPFLFPVRFCSEALPSITGRWIGCQTTSCQATQGSLRCAG